MLKQVLIFAALLPLTSCIPVEDFGTHWDRFGLDKALAGNWKQVPATPDQSRAQGYPIGDVMHVVAKGDAYEITFYEDGKTLTGDAFYQSRRSSRDLIGYLLPVQKRVAFCCIG